MPSEWTVEGSVACMARKLESGIWLGQCEPLGIYLEADSLDELHEQLREAFGLVVRDMLEEGEVDALVEALREASGSDWKPHEVKAKAKGKGRAGAERYAKVVPWHMIAAGQPDVSAQEVA